MRKLKSSPFWAIAMVAALGVGLSACGGDSDTAEAPPVVEPMPTPYETASAAIAAAATAAAAQAAYDAVKDDVTAAQGGMLQMKVNERIAAIQTAARKADQEMALMTAAGMVDTSDLSTAEAIVAANAAIAALQAALDAAADVPDADKAMYQTQLDAAEADVMTAQGALDTAGRMMVQRDALSTAVTDARTKVGAVDDDATDADVMAADNAIAALEMAIEGAEDLPDGDADVASAQGTLDTLEGQLSAAKTSRTAAINDAAEEQRTAAINAAKGLLTEKEAALDALADDATDEDRRDALRMVEAAANALRDALRMNGGSDDDIEAAIRKSATAKVEADALQATITATANAAEKRRMEAIETAQTALTGAETALAELGEDATDKETRDAHRAVEMAADALLKVLEDNDGTADQIAAATMKRDSAKMMADELTSPIEIAEQRKAITDALADLATKVAAVKDDSSDSVVAAADKAIADARKAIADATEVPEATAHVLTVDAYETVLTTAKSTRMAALEAKDEKDRKEAAAVATKAAGTKLKAMQAEAAQTTDAGLGGTAATGEGAYTQTIERDGTGTTITVKDPARPKTSDPKFTLASDLGDGRQMLALKNDADADGDVVEEVVIVGTDIRAPREVAFAKVTGQELNARDLDEAVDADEDGTATNDFTALTVPQIVTGDDGAEQRKLVKSNAFTATTAATLTFDAGDTGGTTEDDADEVAGYYNGAPGTYRCEGTTACTVNITIVKGKPSIDVMSEGWVFTPNAGATSDVPDTSYLHYGFWLKKTTDEDGVLTYNEVETFAGASFDASGDVATVTGTASYDGDAVGVYVHHELSEGGGSIESSTSGHFKADASLTATFGQPAAPNDNIPPNLVNSVTGTIDNFALSGGEDQDWSVNFAKGTITPAAGTFSGVAEGGGASGSYSGTFHGSVTAVEDVVPQPSAVVGEFNANMSNGAVAGAFGANKQ